MVGMIVFNAQANPIKRLSPARQKQAFVNFTFKGNFLKVVVQGIVYIPWIYMYPKTFLPHLVAQLFDFPCS